MHALDLIWLLWIICNSFLITCLTDINPAERFRNHMSHGLRNPIIVPLRFQFERTPACMSPFSFWIETWVFSAFFHCFSRISFYNDCFPFCGSISHRQPLLWKMVMLQYSSVALRELVSNSFSNSITAIKFFGLLRRPRYFHRGSRGNFIHSSSSIPSILSELLPGTLLRHCNKPNAQARQLHPLVCIDSSVPLIPPLWSYVNTVKCSVPQ